jgi:S-adenosylmethionine:tRNA ribosyltransferase-isomerase
MTKLADFGFSLPDDLIADRPAIYRDESRLMIVNKDSGKIEHKKFKNIVDYLKEDDVVVVNDSKVFSCFTLW